MPARENSKTTIAGAVGAFLDAVNGRNEDPHGNLRNLACALDRLSLAYHEGAELQHAPNAAQPPEQDVQDLREKISRRFPDLSGSTAPVTASSAADIADADAIDDLTSITSDLLDVAWCLENTSLEDATRLYRFGFSHTWGRHLCDLRSAVHFAMFGM
ncbi:MAG: DUF5063 domain-containing protein [Hyphomicrobiaceae bacterium]|nr:DUF5063 domain-containing protein [Hyphomicrobiaceae bacterium]